MANLLLLDEAVTHGYTSAELVPLMRRIVETYRDPDEVNRQATSELEGVRVEAASV